MNVTQLNNYVQNAVSSREAINENDSIALLPPRITVVVGISGNNLDIADVAWCENHQEVHIMIYGPVTRCGAS